MSNFHSPAAERTLGYSEVAAGWTTHAVAEDKHERRWAFMLLIGLLTFIATAFEASLLGAEGWSPINLALLVLFTLLFTHVAIGFCQAFFGFLVAIDRPDCRAGAPPAQCGSAAHFETGQAERPPYNPAEFTTLPVSAIVVPIYHEEVDAVYARLRVMHDALESLGAIERFQFFVLSDSTDRRKGAGGRSRPGHVSWPRLGAPGAFFIAGASFLSIARAATSRIFAGAGGACIAI